MVEFDMHVKTLQSYLSAVPEEWTVYAKVDHDETYLYFKDEDGHVRGHLVIGFQHRLTFCHAPEECQS